MKGFGYYGSSYLHDVAVAALFDKRCSAKTIYVIWGVLALRLFCLFP